jgi:hypothetical protein
MKVSEEFPGYFLSGEEIGNKVVPVKVSSVRKEMVPTRPGKPEEEVIALYFEGKKRGMRLNRTRAKELRKITGEDEMEKWIGKTVYLSTQSQRAFGEVIPVIHVQGSEKSNNAPPEQGEIDMNDIELP